MEKKTLTIIIVILVVVTVVGGVVLYHDGVIGTTSIKEIYDNYEDYQNLSVMVKGTYQGSFNSYLWLNDSSTNAAVLIEFDGIIGVSKGEMLIVSGVVKVADFIFFEFPYIEASEVHIPWVLK